jgi:lipocalin-like protein
MIDRRTLALSTLAFGVVLSGHSSFAQSAKEQLVGTWMLVSYESTGRDGKVSPYLGPKPTGTLMLDAKGNYAMILANPDRPKKWGKTREEVSAEDYKSAGMGLVAQFGTWSVDEASKTFIRQNVGALNPTAAGREQKTPMILTGDELKLTDAASGVTGGKVEQTFRRVR